MDKKAENQVILKKIEKDKNTITYRYAVAGDWSRYFLTDSAAITYPFLIEEVPEHIAVIPFLCFMLPLSFVCDGRIVVDSIDKDFADSINNIRDGYFSMYPQIEMKGTVCYKKLIPYQNIPGGG